MLATWNGLGGSGRYLRFRCPVGDHFECYAGSAVACTGSYQIYSASTSSPIFSCGFGKISGQTSIDWLAVTD